MRVTDGQNYDSQDRASIAASRGKNRNTLHKTSGLQTHHSPSQCCGSYTAVTNDVKLVHCALTGGRLVQ